MVMVVLCTYKYVTIIAVPKERLIYFDDWKKSVIKRPGCGTGLATTIPNCTITEIHIIINIKNC